MSTSSKNLHAGQSDAPLSQSEARYREARTVTVVGAVVDALLGIAKIVGGLFTQSYSLIIDGIHSLSDLLTDAIVLVATRHASREADADHPYGHGRIETLATVGLGGSLILVAVGMIADATWRIITPGQLMQPEAGALVIAGISVIAKEWIYHYTIRAARRLKSNLLEANAWHSRTDAISSIIVVIGVLGALMGFEYLDAIAGIGVSLMIGKIGWDLAWKSVRELIDTGLDGFQVEAISEEIRKVSGVTALHMLRTRSMGAQSFVDVHILVQPTLSVSEGHQIGEAVRARLAEKFEDIADVTVHIDPEDDEIASPCEGLPPREEVTGILMRRWTELDAGPEIERLLLHYLDGKIHVDIILPVSNLDAGSDGLAMCRQFRDAVADVDYLGRIELYFHQAE